MGLIYHHSDLVEEAIEFIRANEPPDGYHLCDSGGKDSTVLRHLTILSGVKYESFYACTRIDPPEVMQFLKKHHPETVWKYPKITFWHGIMINQPPAIKMRWCCDKLKKDPTKGGNPNRLIGIRHEESAKRANRPRIDRYRKQNHFHPILLWTEYDIWTHIETYDLPYCSLYDEGWHRIGCLCCPFSSFGEHRRNKIRYPGIYKTFEKVVAAKWHDLKAKGKPMMHNTHEEYIKGWYQKQFFLFKGDEEKEKNIGLGLGSYTKSYTKFV